MINKELQLLAHNSGLGHYFFTPCKRQHKNIFTPLPKSILIPGIRCNIKYCRKISVNRIFDINPLKWAKFSGHPFGPDPVSFMGLFVLKHEDYFVIKCLVAPMKSVTFCSSISMLEVSSISFVRRGSISKVLCP